jgi:hypothetical protein
MAVTGTARVMVSTPGTATFLEGGQTENVNPWRRCRLSPKERLHMITRAALFTLGGAALGLAYQRLIGCRSGACLLTSNPYISAIYGAFLGLFSSGALR